jgi:hypothetical protein
MSILNNLYSELRKKWKMYGSGYAYFQISQFYQIGRFCVAHSTKSLASQFVHAGRYIIDQV